VARPEPILVALGRALREVRDEQRVSQEELERRTGVHRNYVGGIERAERNPTIATTAKLASGLGLTVSELLARAEQL
jgi:transcriptional regulator with XRE-family HTH domain